MRLKITAIFAVGVLILVALSGCRVGVRQTRMDFDRLAENDFSGTKILKTSQISLRGIRNLRLAGHPTKDSYGNKIAVLFRIETSTDEQLHLLVNTDCKIEKADQPYLLKEGSTLIVSTGTEQHVRSWLFEKSNLMQVTLQIPQEYDGLVQAELDACVFQADQIPGKTMKLTLNAGLVHIGSFSGDGAVQVNAGKAEIDNFTGSGSAAVNAGRLDFKKVSLLGDFSLHVNAGKVFFSVPENSRFSFQGRSAAGDIDTFFPTENQGNREEKILAAKVNGGSNRRITASVKAGKLELTKTK